MGGHFAKAIVSIDPSDTSNPITVKKLSKIDIGTKDTHPTHDARIDGDMMYWSTYKNGKDAEQKLEVGVTDLVTGNVVGEASFDYPKEGDYDSTGGPVWYCASGQTDTKFIPVSMSKAGYLDIWDKAKLASDPDNALDHRVWIDGVVGGEDFGTDYLFDHGTNTPDRTKFLLTMNRHDGNAFTGNIDLYYLDMDKLVNGEVKVLQKNRITGTPGATITFRQFFTPDSKYLLQSGADSFFLVDANTLETLHQEFNIGGENHDAMGTPDSKYAILTLRVPDAEGMSKDGQIQLYDIGARAPVGEPVSVCAMCHPAGTAAVLCGIDGVLTVD
jgi:hypothetical protein